MTYWNKFARTTIWLTSARANEGFFDTSVLVPVFYGDHIHHLASLKLFIQLDKASGCYGSHSLVAEAVFRSTLAPETLSWSKRHWVQEWGTHCLG